MAEMRRNHSDCTQHTRESKESCGKAISPLAAGLVCTRLRMWCLRRIFLIDDITTCVESKQKHELATLPAACGNGGLFFCALRG